ncbi:hypothetical protein KUCAC02_025095, partial [Chaenocephalus aceratus]
MQCHGAKDTQTDAWIYRVLLDFKLYGVAAPHLRISYESGTLCVYGHMNVSAAGQMPVMEELVSESHGVMWGRIFLIASCLWSLLMSILGNLLVMTAVCKDRQL